VDGVCERRFTPEDDGPVRDFGDLPGVLVIAKARCILATVFVVPKLVAI
jgi:hypothetical protein